MGEESRSPSYFAIITGPVLDNRQLADSAKILYGRITSLADREGYCWATNKYLADLTGCGERTITRLLSQLQEHGFVQIEMVMSEQKKNMERRVYIGNRAAEGVAKIGETPRQNWRDGIAKNGEVIIKDDKYNNPPISPQGEELFERFWAMYPKKRGKAQAKKAWVRLKPDMELCRVMSAALKRELRSESWQRDNGRYIPYPATWLNGRYWEDEVEDQTPEHLPVGRRYIGTEIVNGEERDIYA